MEKGKNNVTGRSPLYTWIGGLIFAAGFTTLIWALGPDLIHFTETLLPDKGSSWYYWQLPERNFWPMVIVWLSYLAHQFSLWAAIYFAQKDIYDFRSKYILGLPRYGIAAMCITIVFVILHLVQTHVWFDGLAQDVPIMTSQGSVIIMLAIILILENPRRGLFLGRKAGKPFTQQVTAFFR